jgi:hypothetical protein
VFCSGKNCVGDGTLFWMFTVTLGEYKCLGVATIVGVREEVVDGRPQL